MSTRFILFSLVLFLIVTSCSNNQLIGKWKRQDDKAPEYKFETVNHDRCDIAFNPDSTFLIAGDNEEDSTLNSTPGWHFGGDIKGTWRIEKNSLLLKPGGITVDYFLTFEIIELTGKRLVLLSLFDKGDTSKYIIYSRNK